VGKLSDGFFVIKRFLYMCFIVWTSNFGIRALRFFLELAFMDLGFTEFSWIALLEGDLILVALIAWFSMWGVERTETTRGKVHPFFHRPGDIIKIETEDKETGEEIELNLEVERVEFFHLKLNSSKVTVHLKEEGE
jgi:hypothetical protein